MLFTEGRFFLLFALAFLTYWALRSNVARKRWLLVCSCVFYGAWDWRFLGLIFLSSGIDFAAGLALEGPKSDRARRLWLSASIVANVAVLGFFKYFGFFVDSAVALASWLGLPAGPRTLEIVLPVGISFYTFQSMSYTIDVYRRDLRAVRSWSDFALFVAFFPQLVAGPIVRAVEFLPQLERARSWRDDVRVRAALGLFLLGFVKKACVADSIAGAIDGVYAMPPSWSAYSHWTALALYTVQVYCDFSGYSDMAIATAGLLGYRLTKNFDWPLLATDITDWWRRWHISLSTWFRDYLYYPLGGNRKGPVRTYVNLWIVFFLCGLWHGAQWKYVIWGVMCGVYLIGHRMWSRSALGARPSGAVRHAVGWALTTFGVMMWWPVFRGLDFTRTGQQLEILFGLEAGGPRSLSPWWAPGLAAMALVHVATRARLGASLLERLPDWAWTIGFGACAALAAAFTASGYQPFVYFQF
ncbi:MAG: MBOAT family protein [Planctomycetes bacterium]|nr:MBOAT family protein [Planctomycetota bacterium]